MRLGKWLGSLTPREEAAPPSDPARPTGGGILEAYTRKGPSAQNAVDIFAGEWSSRLPEALGSLSAGETELFRDPRIEWMISQIGGLEGLRVLELGPLEGGHTYMAEQAGAAEIVAIEGNSRAYLKCLIVKELLQMRRTSFRFGELLEYLEQATERFDLCMASGVLYHLREPARLFELTGRIADRLFLWTHYYAAERAATDPTFARRLGPPQKVSHRGFHHTLYRYGYGRALTWSGFCGGGEDHSCWLSREDLLAGLEHFGWVERQLAFDDPAHPNGPAVAILAQRMVASGARG